MKKITLILSILLLFLSYTSRAQNVELKKLEVSWVNGTVMFMYDFETNIYLSYGGPGLTVRPFKNRGVLEIRNGFAPYATINLIDGKIKLGLMTELKFSSSKVFQSKLSLHGGWTITGKWVAGVGWKF